MCSATFKPDDITGPIGNELRLLEEELARIFTSRVALIAAIGEHLISIKGKRVRPCLVLLAAKLGQPDVTEAVKVAAAVEIIHTATLLHDDSIDRSELRRGSPTINRLWNDQVSVIMGDHLFCTAFRLLHEARLFEIASVLSLGSDRVTFGEMFQMDLRGRYDIPEETYLDMVRDKTASLFSSACEAGAIIGGLAHVDRVRLKRYGEAIGVAFQIIDDILDFIGDVDLMGKPVGSDLRDGRVTLPLLVALERAGRDEAQKVRASMASSVLGAAEWREIVTFIERHRGVDYCRDKASELARGAMAQIGDLKACPAKGALLSLADYVVSRQR